MTVVRHRLVQEPPDLDASVWRFMRFQKLEDLLRTATLWMTRANLAGDPLEGSYTDANAADYNRTLIDLYGEYGKWLAGRLPVWNEALTGWVYINCWFMHDHESAAMWGYAGPDINERVAVRTTVRELQLAVTDPRDVYLGRMRYIDFATEMFDRGNALPPYLNKARHFDSENEVRLIHVGEFPGRYIVDDPPAADGPAGIQVTVDINRLVAGVVVGRQSTEHLERRVNVLLADLGLPNARRSELERAAKF